MAKVHLACRNSPMYSYVLRQKNCMYFNQNPLDSVQFYGKSIGFGLSKQPNAIPMSLSKQKNCM